jgi:MoaA/NifB/PqqE/SkfB family radical SAM enzyme
MKSKVSSQKVKDMISSPKNLLYRSLGIPLKPKWLVFMLTDACNSRCLHCNIWRKKPTENQLTPIEIENIFSDKLFKDVRYILCTGGEITLRPDLEEIYLRLHKVLPQARLQLSTNALLPQRVVEVAEAMLKNGALLDVGVSLDGIRGGHDIIRGVNGNFKKADQLFRKLTELRDKYEGRLTVSASIVISEFTVDSVCQVREYAKKLKIGIVEAWYNTSSFYDNRKLTDKCVAKEKILEIVRSQPVSVVQQKWLSSLKGKSLKFPCFAMNTFCVIKCNGDLVPCLNQWDLVAGNIRDGSPSEVWRNKRAKEVRSMINKCEGCLNAWGTGWSFESSYYQTLFYYLRNPRILLKKLFKKI